MKNYILSPSAYESLEKLAQNTQWEADFDRCLRFLEAAVEYGEAVIIGKDETGLHYKELGWQPLDVLAACERVG